MNALEALMWRAEEDPRLRSTICGLEELDTTPDWDRFLAAHDWGTRLVPRFRQRVVEPLGGIGAPAWVTDPDFDLHYHVRRVRLPEGAGWTELLAAAEQIAMTPFDRARALWEAVLFEGLPDGRAAYFLKLHHATSDGLGIVDLLSNLHSRTRESNPDKPQPLPPIPEQRTPAQELAHQLARDAQRAAGTAGRAARRRSLRALARPGRDGARRAAARRLAAPGRSARAGPRARRCCAGAACRGASARSTSSSRELRGASKAVGASLNDAFLAALLGAFRRYHEELGPADRADADRGPDLRARRGRHRRRQPHRRGMAGGAGGDRGPGGARCRRSARRCARRAASRRSTRSARSRRCCRGCPGRWSRQLGGGLTKANDLQASNVPRHPRGRLHRGREDRARVPVRPAAGLRAR